MLFLKHCFRLIKDLVSYSWTNEVYWPIPLLVLLMLAGILGAGSQAIAPYIYTLF